MEEHIMKILNYKSFTITGAILGFIFIISLFSGIRQTTAQSYESTKAGIVIDPENKTNISGYVQIAVAWGEHFSPPFKLQRGFIHLEDAMNRYTKIETRLDNHLVLGSEQLFKLPFIFVTTDENFQLTETEKKNVKKYFETGGFMVLDNPAPRWDHSPGGASLKQMLLDTIPHARFAPIPKNHPLYHCFFDFDDGPPNGAEIGIFGGGTDFKQRLMSKKIYALEGVWYKGRLVAVYSDKGYIVKWNENSNNEPQLKIGVNFIVYALTQEGGLIDKN